MGGEGARLCSGPPPSAPPPELVARALLDLRLHADHPVLLHLRIVEPRLWLRMERLQARDQYLQFRQDGFTVGETLRMVAKRFQRDQRSIRRWVLDRKKVASPARGVTAGCGLVTPCTVTETD